MTTPITKDRVTHELKIYPEHFSAVCTGVKRAELRKNDRDFKVGDTLLLMETPRGSCHSTGEYIDVTITHIADVGEWMPGYVLLSIALAAMDAEPVGEFYHEKQGGWYEISEGDKVPDNRRIPLYRHAQPAPVLPKATPSLKAMMQALDAFYAEEEVPERGMLLAFRILLDDTCRTAVQSFGNPEQLEPVSQPYKLPPNSFTDAELEMMAHGDNPQANAYRELLAFRRNNPVIPDGSANMLRRWLAFGRALQSSGSQLPRHLIAETESMLTAPQQER